MKKDRKETGKKILAGGALLMAAAIIALALAYHFQKTQGMIEKAGKQEAAAEETMLEELQKVSLYLNQMEETVAGNREALSGLQEERTDFFDRTDILKEEIAGVEEILNQYISVAVEADDETVLQIQEVLEALSFVREEIGQAQEQMKMALAGMEDNAADRQESTEQNFSAVKKQISGAEEELLAACEELAKAAEANRVGEQKEHQEQRKRIEEASGRLEGLHTSYTEEICLLMESESENLQMLIDGRVDFLSGRLEELQGQIEGAETEVESILTAMEADAEERQEEIESAFEEVKESLLLIQENYETAQEEVKSLLLQLKQAEDENHSELVSVLGQMESDMEERGQNNLSLIMESVSQLSESYQASLDLLKSEMTDSFQDIYSGMNEQFRILNTNLSSQYENLSAVVSSGDDTLRQYLENSFADIDSSLQSVFTYVSDGKRLLASALLTKGVSCKEDATFQEIYQAILNIPQQTVLGVEKLPGIISYEYHYHVDADGKNPHTERMPGAGGCYTLLIYHVHEGSSAGGGCYTNPVYHSHDSSCYTYGLVHSCHTVSADCHGTDDIGRTWYTWTYSCGATVTGTSGDGYHGHNTVKQGGHGGHPPHHEK